MGVTVVVPPNLLTTKIQARVPPTFTAQRRTGRGMASACRASGWRGQKINAQHVSTLQGNCSHRIRRRTATSEATFLFHSPHFYPFTTHVTQALPLKSIKGEAGVKSRGRRREKTQHTTPLTRDLGTSPSLEELVTPTMSTPVQGNTNPSETHWK
jgi:hypothetical protein